MPDGTPLPEEAKFSDAEIVQHEQNTPCRGEQPIVGFCPVHGYAWYFCEKRAIADAAARKAYEAGVQAERARIVAWLRTRPGGYYLAEMLERPDVRAE